MKVSVRVRVRVRVSVSVRVGVRVRVRVTVSVSVRVGVSVSVRVRVRVRVRVDGAVARGHLRQLHHRWWSLAAVDVPAPLAGQLLPPVPLARLVSTQHLRPGWDSGWGWGWDSGWGCGSASGPGWVRGLG